MRKAIRAFAAAEALLALVGLSLAWGFSVPLFMEVTTRAVVLALGVTGILLVVNFFLYRAGRRWEGASGVYAFLEDDVFPLFRGASVAQIVVLGSLAGLGEEIFFRGLLQPVIGLPAASLVFGLLHGPARRLWPLAAWAVVMGAVLGALYQLTGNLLVPILIHGLYDGIALEYVSRRTAREPSEEGPSPEVDSGGSPRTPTTTHESTETDREHEKYARRDGSAPSRGSSDE